MAARKIGGPPGRVKPPAGPLRRGHGLRRAGVGAYPWRGSRRPRRAVAPRPAARHATHTNGTSLTLRDALTRNRAATDPAAADPRLRGRAYARPFGAVWKAALSVAGARRGWTITSSDPRRGEIRAEARTTLWKFVDDVEIRLSLDAEGQTRVDLVSASRKGSADFGANARRIDRFLRRLDAALAVG